MQFRHANFPACANIIPFALHSQRLSSLLNAIVQETRTASDPDTLTDYMNLTATVASLLDEAQMYSIMAISELQQRNAQVGNYLTKFEAIESVISNWSIRLAPPKTMSHRKRRRSTSVDDDEMRTTRRRIDVEIEDALRMTPSLSGTLTNSPSTDDCMEIDDLNTWWTDPFYD